MGSNLARCLSKKGVELALYNRTKARALELAREVGGGVYDSPGELLKNVDVAIVFVYDDYALKSVVANLVKNSSAGLEGRVLLNASTVTPMASLEASTLLKTVGVNYVEAPVYGSADEARECKLLTMLACDEGVREAAMAAARLYSSDVVYVGEPPSAIAIKLALNNIGLALPALLAESLMLLEAWGADLNSFISIARKLWFGALLERYWERVLTEKPPRFKLAAAGKDYWCIASALKAKGLPSLVSDAISSLFLTAASGGYGEKDYPQVARYYLELAKKYRGKSPQSVP